MRKLTISLFLTCAALFVCAQEPTIQEIAQSGWLCTPTFFEAKSKADREKALNLWLESVSYELHMRRGGMPERYQYQKPNEGIGEHMQAAVPAFRGIFGKELGELTVKQRKQIAKELRSITKEQWVHNALIYPLNQKDGHPTLKRWIAQFDAQVPPGRRLEQLGRPNAEVNTDKIKLQVFDQHFGRYRMEMFVSVNGTNSRRDTWEITKTTGAMIVFTESGKILKQEIRDISLQVWLSDRDMASTNRHSFMVRLGEVDEKVYVAIIEQTCRWGVSSRLVKWYDECAEAGGNRRGRQFSSYVTAFIDNDMKQVNSSTIAVGQSLPITNGNVLRIF